MSVITLSNGTPSRRSDALSRPIRTLLPPASTAAVSMVKGPKAGKNLGALPPDPQQGNVSPCTPI